MNHIKQILVRPWKRSASEGFFVSMAFWALVGAATLFLSVLSLVALTRVYNLGYFPEFAIPLVNWFFEWVVLGLVLFSLASAGVASVRALSQTFKTEAHKEDNHDG